MTPFITLLAIPLVLSGVYFIAAAYRRFREGRRQPLPPGPPGLPFIGNLFNIPKVEPWKGYQALSKRYGNIVSLRVMGQCIIMINDRQCAQELLEKRSAIYSSRVQSVIAERCGWGWNFAFMPYGPRWRVHRRMMWQHFHPNIVRRYHEVQEEAARRLLVRLIDTPEELAENIRLSIASVIIKVTYGLDTSGTNDKYIRAFEDAISSVELLTSGSGSVVQAMPFLAYLPIWLPGRAGALQRRMAYYREATTKMRDMPWNDAIAAIMALKAPASFASALQEEISIVPHLEAASLEEMAKSVAALVYGAGLDTTDAVMRAFFFAMSHNPEVQRKAREELDTVIGPSRLPCIADRNSLPCVNAVVKELLRWHAAVPLGVPHVSTADDEFDGYFIPKNSTIMVNVWSILHDPETFPDPERFEPERFLKDGVLNPDVLDPAELMFGFGRRVCPGKYFAEATLFINIATALHTTEISPPLDENGQPIHVEMKIVSDLVIHIEDCRCTIKPRSAAAEHLVRGL